MYRCVAATAWAPPPPRPLVLYGNEAKGSIVDGRDCFGNANNITHVPRALDWISFDFYNPPASYVRRWYEEHLYPKMAPHQRALLVPDASSSAHLRPDTTGPPPGWAVADMVHRAWEYFEWAAGDTSGRIVGLNPWHWTTVNFTRGGYWEKGVESIPPLRDAWSAIGRAILKNNAHSQ